ncbi:26S proteasome non-ATPase regulatory subunit 13-like [Zophobas morio]|uniref:26S proteasome non-ATPase regulatory subunit 13-like n=1 Tax=Zophobas morio TaxID=2755281 RepID=UPI00308293E1
MFYREALRFLGCTDVESLDLSTQQSFAIDLSLAALIADNVYNFGELIIHPIFNSLKNSAHFWLYKLICAFNGGDIKTFEELQLYWRKENELLNNIHRIRRKIQLMTLLHIVFEKPTHERSLSFAYIAEQCSIPVNEVETLCMKALSLNLLKGTIDEVSQLVRVTWLQPRVLDLGQIALVSEQLKTWCTRLEDAIVFANSFGFRDSEKITS